MALEFLNNAKENFINALFGTPTQVEGSNQSIGYGEAIDNYLNNLGEQEYIKKLLNKPVEERMSLDTIRKGVANGLNYSVPEIAQAQKELGINTTKTGEEIYKAQLGEFNQPTTLNVGVSNAPRQGGLINDFISGFRENATQGFDVNNLAPQRKGLATRIGEGLGTLARFYDKPIGRMAVATGLSMLTDEANPLGEGVKAYVGRQNNMTQDRVYRNQLKQLGMTDDDVNAIPGIVTKDVFEGVTSGMRLGNQRMTYGQLAMLDDDIAEEVRKNPALANMFVPINVARDIYSLKRKTAQGKMAEIAAKTKKTEAETKQVGKPKVNISIKQGGTTSRIVHEGGSPKPDKKTTTTQDTGGRPRGAVKILAPDGKVRFIPADKVNEALKAGGKRI